MKILSHYNAVQRKDGAVFTDIFGHWKEVFDSERELTLKCLKLARKRSLNMAYREEQIAQLINYYFATHEDITDASLNTTSEVTDIDDYSKKVIAIDKLINFFSEFEFKPNFRFINTFAYATHSNTNTQYVKNYFALTGNTSINAIVDKMSSSEFKSICSVIHDLPQPSTKINTRFKLYYGSQGSGKTTQAMMETDGICMVCHSAMLPSDLMEDFTFVDGKAEFKPSALQEAMTNGYAITLDEINLLPFESLRFLQSVLDGKSQFEYKGKTIEIKDGFKIIGTMNLQVNGATYALPEPLVDRAEELKEFNLVAEDLVEALN